MSIILCLCFHVLMLEHGLCFYFLTVFFVLHLTAPVLSSEIKLCFEDKKMEARTTTKQPGGDLSIISFNS